MTRLFFVMGSFSAFLSVALGAFAAHVLKQKLAPEMFSIFEVGVRYHVYHSFALFVVAWASAHWDQTNFFAAGLLFALGILFFSGSLYLLSVAGLRWLGAITPLGGLCFLTGWFWLAYKVWQAR